MKKKRILLTGDDGYNSLGTRLLVHFLKDKYDLAIAGTREQMSGVGGHGSFKDGGRWGKKAVDGVAALWVDGYPTDAIECAQGYFKEKFDLVISGINWGANIGCALNGSGTFSAANRSLFLKLATNAIAISWHTPPEGWYHQHSGDTALDELIPYPGDVAFRVIELAIKKNFWGVPLLNINLPIQKSTVVKFTNFWPDLTQLYFYPLKMDRKTNRFTYPFREQEGINYPDEFDAGAIRSGYISITPCQLSPIDETVFQKMKNRRYKL